MQTYHGSCHCGAVRFEVEADLGQLTRCICSICTKKGGLFCYVPPQRFRQLRGVEEVTSYRFNTETVEHCFCRNCGMHTFGHPRSAPELFLVNVRCLDDFDLETEAFEVQVFDRRNWEAALKARQEKTAE